VVGEEKYLAAGIGTRWVLYPAKGRDGFGKPSRAELLSAPAHLTPQQSVNRINAMRSTRISSWGYFRGCAGAGVSCSRGQLQRLLEGSLQKASSEDSGTSRQQTGRSSEISALKPLMPPILMKINVNETPRFQEPHCLLGFHVGSTLGNRSKGTGGTPSSGFAALLDCISGARANADRSGRARCLGLPWVPFAAPSGMGGRKSPAVAAAELTPLWLRKHVLLIGRTQFQEHPASSTAYGRRNRGVAH